MMNSSAITIDAKVLNLIAEIDEFKGRWDLLGRLAPAKLRSLRPSTEIPPRCISGNWCSRDI